MVSKNSFTLVNPQNGALSFKIYSFIDHSNFDHVQRLNYYSMVWIKRGKGRVVSDFSTYEFDSGSLACFSPYQPFMFSSDNDMEGLVLNFHPDFFCIHKHQSEVACNGVLFNNIYQPPVVKIDETTAATFDLLINQMKTEMTNAALAQYESIISYLKIFLITASRLKIDQQPDTGLKSSAGKEPFILQNLKNYIELHYKTKHSASDYADMLAITPKSLAKITRLHLNKTLTDLISQRIVIEAKRELYLTSKSVKEIAYGLGYDDEHYFSRFFKKNAEVSPQLYRDTLGFARGEV